MKTFFLAIKAFFRVFKDREFAKEVTNLLDPTKDEKKEETQPKQALALLALLQEEGRLIDFLQEDIADYEDEQIGAAVRNIHGKSRKVLKDMFDIVPVINDRQDGENITVEEGFDKNEIKLVGEVSGNPPFKGELKHHGWKITKAKFPPKLTNYAIIAPAEVEV